MYITIPCWPAAYLARFGNRYLTKGTRVQGTDLQRIPAGRVYVRIVIVLGDSPRLTVFFPLSLLSPPFFFPSSPPQTGICSFCAIRRFRLCPLQDHLSVSILYFSSNLSYHLSVLKKASPLPALVTQRRQPESPFYLPLSSDFPWLVRTIS